MTIAVERKNSAQIHADLLVVGLFEGQKKLSGTGASLDKALGGLVQSFITDERFEGKEREMLLIQTHGKVPAKRILIIGLGKQKKFSSNILRQISAAVVRKGKELKTKRVLMVLHENAHGLAARRAAQVIAEGALLGSYHYLDYHGQETRDEHAKQRVEEVMLVDTSSSVTKELERGVADGVLEAEATIFARDLGNAPASDMTPRHLVDVAKHIAQRSRDVRVEIFDAKEVERRGMGAFLAIAKGSEEPPYFIHLSYKPKGKKAKKIFLVGKGVTFDSGGLSLKPANYMENMKIDMAGAATVLGIFSKISILQPHVEVHGVIAATENMPSGKAVKPGDIARAMNGKTIEIANTDAEGRVTLADALSFAVQEKADMIIDLATLTGSCMVALGNDIAALFSNSEKLASDIKVSAEEAGEPVWQMPMPPEYKGNIKSKVADLKNSEPTRYGGAISAALFLKEFVGTTPWIHLDIAGPAEAERDTYPHLPIGATGFGVRTLIHWLKKFR